MNRLANETSPYLQQHKDNPVDWYPWGDEAFARARDEGRPVLLSIGYSSCHWCHVMAHESFEDDATAAVMNELFVNVKVDREERPDVDAVYMEAVQAMSGHGGWPMTVFLTPDGRPFFAGTYFPKEPSHGRPSFVQLCHAVAEAWAGRRDEVVEQADEIAEAVRARSGTGILGGVRGDDGHDHAIDVELLRHATAALLEAHDPEWGGFGRAPKFPQTMALDHLLRAGLLDGDDQALAAVTTTLDAMASGGIYDHLGGGFARYSTDAFWMVPHFEKMLYDQANLVRIYTRAWKATGLDRWRQVVAETVTYVLRDLTVAEGGFCSAEDADSEGEEGRFYVWRPEAIADVLGAAGFDADAVARVQEWYGVTKSGNFEGSNILHRPARGRLLRSNEIEAARAALLEARSKRVRPGLDDKVLTEWNGLFVAALAEAGAAMGEPAWVAAAERAADFLLSSLRDADGRWLRSWQGGRAQHRAYAADHAALLDAFVRLYEATGRARWVDEARAVADALIRWHGDDDEGGFFTTAHDAEQLIVRQKDVFDGATPSANAMAALALLRLSTLTGDRTYADPAERILALLRTFLAHQPSAFTHLLAAAEIVARGPVEIVIAGDRPDLVTEAHRPYLPTAVIAWGEHLESPLWEGRQDAAAYVCRDYACLTPATTPEALAGQLDSLVRR